VRAGGDLGDKVLQNEMGQSGLGMCQFDKSKCLRVGVEGFL
jgi:hypothetical protein